MREHIQFRSENKPLLHPVFTLFAYCGLLEWTQSKPEVNLEWARRVKPHQKYTLEKYAACVFEIQKGAEKTSCNMVR